jgi:hypothetical protein
VKKNYFWLIKLQKPLNRKPYKAVVLILLVTVWSSTIMGQAKPPGSKLNLMMEGRIHYGFFWQTHLELERFSAHFPSFEISVERATNGKHRWEFMYGYPIIGISAFASFLGGFNEIGSAVGVYPFINFPLVQDQHNSLNFRVGLGITYLTNHFDRLNNYKNFAIGSSVNAIASLYLEYRYKISRRSTFFVASGLTHFSNGPTKTPNYGLNILTLTSGMAFFIGEPNNFTKKDWRPELYPYEFDGKKFLYWYTGFHAGTKDMTATLGDRFMIVAAWSNLMAQISYKSRIGIGIDLTYDFSDEVILDNHDICPSFGNVAKLGINAAYELMLDRLSFMIYFGAYITGKEKSEGNIYQRVNLKYLITKNIFLYLTLNGHFGRAEYIGLGTGYQLDFIYKRKFKHH